MYTIIDGDIQQEKEYLSSTSPNAHVTSNLVSWRSNGYGIDRKLEHSTTNPVISLINKHIVTDNDKENNLIGIPDTNVQERWKRDGVKGIFRGMKFIARIRRPTSTSYTDPIYEKCLCEINVNEYGLVAVSVYFSNAYSRNFLILIYTRLTLERKDTNSSLKTFLWVCHLMRKRRNVHFSKNSLEDLPNQEIRIRSLLFL
jgi:hypothetical protein